MSKLEVNTVAPQCGTTLTLGESGDTVTLGSGASQSGFGRTGTVDWDTTPKTASFTAVSGDGFFVNTTSSAITVTLPAGTANAIVSLADYAATWQTNNVTVTPNGTDKIGGTNADATLSTEGQSVTFVYVDSIQGWINTIDSTSNVRGVAEYNVQYLVVAGGGGTRWDTGGGGGAGGYRASGYGPAPLQGTAITVEEGTSFPITVGSGGAGGPSNPSDGQPGSNSIFSTITSTGGGGGNGGAGGSGAGPNGAGNTPPVSPPQGNPGGDSGGGGGNGVGGCRPSPGQGGQGGAGAPNTIGSGTPFSRTVFAGGGAGGSDPPGGSPQPNATGAPGGGGTGGARNSDTSTSGAANSGGGGGGAGANFVGVSGGSGVVILRYTTADAPPGTSGGTKSTCGSDTIHVFTGPGTFSG